MVLNSCVCCRNHAHTALSTASSSKESVPPKDVVLEGQTSGNRSGRGPGCKVDAGGLAT